MTEHWVQDGRYFRLASETDRFLGYCVDDETTAEVVRLHNSELARDPKNSEAEPNQN